MAQLLSAPPERITNLALLPSEIADHISTAEGRALRMILGLDNPDRLDGSLICDRMEEIIASIEAQVAGKELKLALAVSLGRNSNLSAAIRRASNNEVDLNDAPRQLKFINDDLSEEPFATQEGDPPRPVLVGRYLTYFSSPIQPALLDGTRVMGIRSMRSCEGRAWAGRGRHCKDRTTELGYR